MGIDVYLHWEGQTEAERKAQYTGFSTQHFHVGYLREAYHGGPYATKVLVAEGWDVAKAVISANVLRERLPKTIEVAKERSLYVYKSFLNEDDPVIQSFVQFVELAERKEAETGRPCEVIVSY